MTNGYDKRMHPRKDLRTAVVFDDEFGDGLFYVYSENISMGGLYLASNVPLRVGTMLFLSFHLPGYKRQMRVTGEVVRVQRPGGNEDGIGIRFVGVPATILKKLEGFLS